MADDKLVLDHITRIFKGDVFCKGKISLFIIHSDPIDIGQEWLT